MSIATKLIKKIAKEKSEKVSIIVPIFNKVDITLQMLNYLFKNTQDYPYEIIIIDNNSTDNSEVLIKDFFQKNKPKEVEGMYIKNPENKGFSIANNEGAKIAKNRQNNLLRFTR